MRPGPPSKPWEEEEERSLIIDLKRHALVELIQKVSTKEEESV